MSRPPEPDFGSEFNDIPDPYAGSGTLAALRLPEPTASANRASVKRRRWLSLSAGSAWLFAHLAVYGVREDFPTLPVPYVAALIGVPSLLAGASLYGALAVGRAGLGLRAGLVSALAVLGPLTFSALALGAPLPRASAPGQSSFLGICVCFDITLAWTAVPLLCAGLSLTGAFATGSRSRSALVGAAIGLLAGAIMNLHCPNIAPLHVFVGHGVPVMVATLLGAITLASTTRA